MTHFLLINWVNAGQGFDNCLSYNNDTTSYNSLTKFSFFDNDNVNNGVVVNICCNESQCLLCPSGTSNFVCNKINKGIFCLGGGCAGIIGNFLIATSSALGIGNCPDLSTMINYLKTNEVPKQFIGKEYAYFPPYSSCSSNNTCTILNGCNWDNGGWTCYNYKNNNESCFLQWPAPFPNNFLTSTSASTAFLSENPSNFPNSNKIVISIGTTVGIISISGMTYYLIKKKNREKTHQLVKEIMKSLINEELKEKDAERSSDLFKTWFNDSCAIIINERKILPWKNIYSLWIVTHEPAFGKTEEKINCLKVGKMTPVKDKWGEVMEDFKKILNSDHPAAGIYNSKYTTELPPLIQDYLNITKRKIKISPLFNPDDYIKPYDIIKRKIDNLGVSHHYAIYLGDWSGKMQQVVHISGSKRKIGKTSELYARVSDWKIFLKEAKEVKVYHPFIPFKKPELIKKHIGIAEKAKYGEGEYKLFGNNCEHFATTCVYGLGMSQQTRSVIGKTDYLLKSIEESNKQFKELAENKKSSNLEEMGGQEYVVDLDKWAEEKEKTETQIQIPPK